MLCKAHRTLVTRLVPHICGEFGSGSTGRSKEAFTAVPASENKHNNSLTSSNLNSSHNVFFYLFSLCPTFHTSWSIINCLLLTRSMKENVKHKCSAHLSTVCKVKRSSLEDLMSGKHLVESETRRMSCLSTCPTHVLHIPTPGI